MNQSQRRSGERDGPGPHSYRIEEDALGEVSVPAEHLWGAQTERSRANFPIGVDRFRWGRPVIRALGILKKCAALANGELGELPHDKVDLIVRAAQEVIDGKLDDEFPLVVFQTGSGTQTNMNANEVIANRAIQLAGGVVGSKKPIHPNDDVNHGQSSNDTFPTAMHIADGRASSSTACCPRSRALRDTLDAKARGVRRRRDDRPHAPAGRDAADARPGDLRLGGAARRRAARRIARALPGLLRAGDRRHRGRHRAQRASALRRDGGAARSREETGKPFVSAPNKFAALSAHDAMVNVSAALRTLAGALMKIANDVRWYASGPRAGIGETDDPGERAGLVDHAGQDQPDAVRGADDGRACRCSATTTRSPSPARRAISSSTSTSR